MKPQISFDDFSKLDLRIGKVLHAERKEGSQKLLRLKVDFGEEGERNILSGIAQWYSPEKIIGKLFVFVINLESRNIMGEESQGMILAADAKKPSLATGKPVPLKPSSKVNPGTSIR